MKNWKKAVAGILAFSCVCLSLPKDVTAADVTGEFTAVAMNVDGLPNSILGISINSDGPGSDGTKAISQKMASYGWDVIGVSEDFNYNTELMSSLTDYNSGTHRGGVSGLSNNTDGLNLIWKKSISATGEKWTSWNTHYSTGIFGTGNGADGMIDKGYRYYQVTVADGVNLDVYILHMDADSAAGDIAARESQLTQLADAIKASNNKNPIIVMGDTNCRYTRENLKTLFIDAINADERFVINDCWIEFCKKDIYPTYGSASLMVDDLGYVEGEVVDKMFYINNSDSNVTLQLNSYKIDTSFVKDDGTGLADHYPAVGTFYYTLKSAPEVHEHNYVLTSETSATCTTEGSKTYTCECGDSYTDVVGAIGHNYISTSEVAASCTVAGSKTYTCQNCQDSYTDVIPATGHVYVGGVCTVCGDKDPNAITGTTVLGKAIDTITGGGKYAVVFPAQNKSYTLNYAEDGQLSSAAIETVSGTAINQNAIWTVEESGKGYTISTEINGVKKYLARVKTFVGYGYKIGLQDSAFVWTVKPNSSTQSFRVTTKIVGTDYALRYYNEKYDWIVSTRRADIKLYEVNEQ